MILFGLYWGAVAILLPLFMRVGPLVSARYSKDIFFGFCVVLSLLLFGIKKHKNKPLYLISGFFIISGFFNQYSFASTNVQFQFIMMCGGILLLNQTIGLMTLNGIIKLKKCLAISCIIQSIFVCVSYFEINLYSSMIEFLLNAKTLGSNLEELKEVPKAIGSLGNRNVSGAFIASTIPFLFIGKMRLFIPLCFSALFLTNSAMPTLALLPGIAVFTYISVLKRKYLLHFLGLGVLITTVLFINSDNGGFFTAGTRLGAWRLALDLVTLKSFIFGNGLGFVYDNYKLFSHGVENFRQLHNEYLSIFISFGAIGISAISYFLIKNKEKLLKGDLMILSSIAIISGNAVGFHNLHISSTALILILLIGAILRDSSCREAGIIK